MTACHAEARENGGELFVTGCHEILKKYYGYRLDYMNLETIEKKIADLYGHAGDVDDEIRKEISEFVKNEYSPFEVEVKETGRTDKWKYKIFLNGQFYSWVEVDETYFYKMIIHCAKSNKRVFFDIEGIKEFCSNIRIREDKTIGRWFDCSQLVA